MTPLPEILAAALLGQWSYSQTERRPHTPAQKQAVSSAPSFPERAAKVAEAFSPSANPRPAMRPKPGTAEATLHHNSTPVAGWRRFSANAAFEFWGFQDADGIFRYTNFRPVTPASTYLEPVVIPSIASSPDSPALFPSVIPPLFPPGGT